MDADGLTFACATSAEERVAKRLGLDAVRVGLGVANGVPEGRLVSFGVAGSLGGLEVGDVLDATRVVDETGATLWEGPGLGVRGARAGVLLGGDVLVHDAAERDQLARGERRRRGRHGERHARAQRPARRRRPRDLRRRVERGRGRSTRRFTPTAGRTSPGSLRWVATQRGDADPLDPRARCGR